MRTDFGETESSLTNDASNMSTMAIALIIRVIIGNRSIGTIVSVANEVVAAGDLAVRPDAPAKTRVKIVDAGVDDTDVDTLASDMHFFVDFVYSRHNVDGLGIYSPSRKGGVVGTIKGNTLLWDRRWKDGDGFDSNDTVGVGQMDEVFVLLEGQRSANEELIVIFKSDIHVSDATACKVFVEIGVGLEAQSESEKKPGA